MLDEGTLNATVSRARIASSIKKNVRQCSTSCSNQKYGPGKRATLYDQMMSNTSTVCSSDARASAASCTQKKKNLVIVLVPRRLPVLHWYRLIWYR